MSCNHCLCLGNHQFFEGGILHELHQRVYNLFLMLQYHFWFLVYQRIHHSVPKRQIHLPRLKALHTGQALLSRFDGPKGCYSKHVPCQCDGAFEHLPHLINRFPGAVLLLADLSVQPAFHRGDEVVGGGAGHGEEAQDELAVLHAHVRRVGFQNQHHVLVLGQLRQQLRVHALVDAVAQLLLVQLGRPHVQALKHLEHKLRLRLVHDGVHVDGVVLDGLLLDLVQIRETRSVELLVHLEA
mmetsp:Transcript_44015/g.84087  ORF Transcript_44015/g.84087 Transcript_44015/m.84087 type:complete len:240 (+) Transcript_44015:153-872(+)